MYTMCLGLIPGKVSPLDYTCSYPHAIIIALSLVLDLTTCPLLRKSLMHQLEFFQLILECGKDQPDCKIDNYYIALVIRQQTFALGDCCSCIYDSAASPVLLLSPPPSSKQQGLLLPSFLHPSSPPLPHAEDEPLALSPGPSSTAPVPHVS